MLCRELRGESVGARFEGEPGVRLVGDAVAQVAAEDFNDPQPDDVAEELREMFRKGLVPRRGDGAHERHEDDVEAHVDDDAEGGTLPELDLGKRSASTQ